MTIKVYWDNNEKTIYRWDYLPGWTWDDYDLAHRMTTRLLSNVTHDVTAILNYQHTTPPPGRKVFDEWRDSGVLAFQHLRTIVVVDAPPVVRSLNRVYEKSLVRHGRKVLYADSIEEARALLQTRAAPPPDEIHP